MIKAELHVTKAISFDSSKLTSEEVAKFKKINTEISNWFLANKVELPITPDLDMSIEINSFLKNAKGLSSETTEEIDMESIYFEITEIIICNGYLDIRFD